MQEGSQFKNALMCLKFWKEMKHSWNYELSHCAFMDVSHPSTRKACHLWRHHSTVHSQFIVRVTFKLKKIALGKMCLVLNTLLTIHPSPLLMFPKISTMRLCFQGCKTFIRNLALSFRKAWQSKVHKIKNIHLKPKEEIH